MKTAFAFCLMMAGVMIPGAGYAQTLTELGTVAAAESTTPLPPAAVNAPEEAVAPADAPPATASAAPVDMSAVSKSLFFNTQELASIQQAKQGYVAPAAGTLEPQAAAINMGPRTLKLAGIVYNSDNDWIIWFNGERVHPKTLPENVKGLIVKKDRIAVRWLDKATNRIISLVLRPHQQYNLDTDTISVGTE